MACRPMLLSEPSRVFISYARKDGATLAQRLQKDLEEQGFDAWLDTQRIDGGAVWSMELDEAIDSRQVVIALLSPASYISEICRAEQLRALDKGKRVIPVVVLDQRGQRLVPLLHLRLERFSRNPRQRLCTIAPSQSGSPFSVSTTGRGQKQNSCHSMYWLRVS